VSSKDFWSSFISFLSKFCRNALQPPNCAPWSNHMWTHVSILLLAFLALWSAATYVSMEEGQNYSFSSGSRPHKFFSSCNASELTQNHFPYQCWHHWQYGTADCFDSSLLISPAAVYLFDLFTNLHCASSHDRLHQVSGWLSTSRDGWWVVQESFN
jgi:hypothetical protein